MLLQRHIKFGVSMFWDFFEGNISSVERLHAGFLFSVCFIGGNETTINSWEFLVRVGAGVMDVLDESVVPNGSRSHNRNIAVPTMDDWFPILLVAPNEV